MVQKTLGRPEGTLGSTSVPLSGKMKQNSINFQSIKSSVLNITHVQSIS